MLQDCRRFTCLSIRFPERKENGEKSETALAFAADLVIFHRSRRGERTGQHF
jgi:hypothetical protein